MSKERYQVRHFIAALGVSTALFVGFLVSPAPRALEDWMISLGDQDEEWSKDIQNTGGVDVKVDKDRTWVLVSLRSSGSRWNATRKVDILSDRLGSLGECSRLVLGGDVEAIKVPFPNSEKAVAVFFVRKDKPSA